MEGRQRRSFTDDYKRQAVDLVASSGRPPDYSSDKPIAGGPWPRSHPSSSDAPPAVAASVA
jgi:hypothetical protein